MLIYKCNNINILFHFYFHFSPPSSSYSLPFSSLLSSSSSSFAWSSVFLFMLVFPAPDHTFNVENKDDSVSCKWMNKSLKGYTYRGCILFCTRRIVSGVWWPMRLWQTWWLNNSVSTLLLAVQFDSIPYVYPPTYAPSPLPIPPLPWSSWHDTYQTTRVRYFLHLQIEFKKVCLQTLSLYKCTMGFSKSD